MAQASAHSVGLLAGQPGESRRQVGWLVFGAGLLGVVAVLPVEAQVAALFGAPEPFPWFAARHLVQGILVMAIATGLGLRLARQIGLGAPLVEAWLAGKAIGARLRVTLVPAAAIGAAAAAGILLVQPLLFPPSMDPDRMHALFHELPLWQLLLRCFGAINEEVVFRLYLLSLLAWGITRVQRAPGLPAIGVFWAATLIAAVAFGLVHLALDAQISTPTLPLIARALAINGWLGVIFGFLYIRRGLEAAIVAHFAADLVLFLIR